MRSLSSGCIGGLAQPLMARMPWFADARCGERGTLAVAWRMSGCVVLTPCEGTARAYDRMRPLIVVVGVLGMIHGPSPLRPPRHAKANESSPFLLLQLKDRPCWNPYASTPSG